MSNNAMTVSSARGAVLADWLPGAWVRDIGLVAGLVLGLAASAQLAIPLPFTPVPVTLQTLVVLVGAAAMGPRLSVAGAATYLSLGVAGVPWFAISGGATLGYIVGFVAASALVGCLARFGHDRRPLGALTIMISGNLVIYACGVPVLAAVSGLTLTEAISAGLIPFLVGDAIKVALAVALLPSLWQLVWRADRDR